MNPTDSSYPADAALLTALHEVLSLLAQDDAPEPVFAQAAEKALDSLGNLEVQEVLLLRATGTPLAYSYYGAVPVPPSVYETDKAECLDYLDSVRKKLEGMTVNTEFSLEQAAVGILSVAETAGCDLIVMTSHGRSGLQRFLMGSVAERVVRYARCPVLIVGRQIATEESQA